MILPGSYAATLLILLLSMICWGSWANTYKLCPSKWRFELFYFDFAIGVFIAAVIAALTFGSLGWDGFSFMDDLRLAGKRSDALAFLAGVIFNLANMLLVGAIAIAGMAVAFPIGIGIALIEGVALNYLINPVGNPVFLFTGAGVIMLAILFDALAWRQYATAVSLAAVQQGRTRSTRRKTGTKGIVISIVSGLLMGLFYPFVEMARAGETGLGPYSVAFVFALGVLLSTFVFNLFFLNLPLQGQPVDMFDYFRARLKTHAFGIFGGMVWCAGAVSNFVAARAAGKAQVGPAVSYGIGQGATMISALWGLFVWKEFAGADGRVRAFLGVMLFLFVAGLALVSTAPLFVNR
jgi:glucose uptake protein